MALLNMIFTFLFFLGGSGEAFGDSLPGQNVAVIFDGGNPDGSVGIVGQELLELGTVYENFEVIGFSGGGGSPPASWRAGASGGEPQAIVVKDLVSQDAIKWLEDGEIDPLILSRARRLFMAKQMRAIYEAQLRYRDLFGDHFAPDLKTLLDQGLLANGFSSGAQKQNYHFYIAETGQTPRLALWPREPTFVAVAEPLNPEEDPAYFSVDHLGQVRFAPSLNQLSWGPVWDYADRSGGPKSREVTYEA